MAWFRLLIRGENFPNGDSDLLGFYVTRFVEAIDEADAESKALAELRADPKLTLPPGVMPTPTPRVFFEEISEWPAERVPNIQLGIAWYSMME
jgi:hypothetical protein